MRFHTVDVQGKFWTQRVSDIDTARHKTLVDEGRIVYSEANGKLYYGKRSDWAIVMGKYDFMTADTRMLFGYIPLPDGWNINLTKNDMTVLISYDAAKVGQISGTWTIQGMVDSNVHDHSGTSGPADSTVARGLSDVRSPQAAGPTHTHSIIGAGIHKHGFDISWRPEYVKFVEAKFE